MKYIVYASRVDYIPFRVPFAPDFDQLSNAQDFCDKYDTAGNPLVILPFTDEGILDL